MSLSFWAKRLVFPGLDLGTLCRYRRLPPYFLTGNLLTLDAGCGNGALALEAYRKGNSVLGISFDKDQVNNNRSYFARLGVDPKRLEFQECNLYELKKLNRKFDQIICSETLEHIARDAEVIAQFHDLLNPGGVLHLCCPYAKHPDNNLGRVNNPEDGGHVRDGYTLESYKAILEPAGFRIEEQAGLLSPLLLKLDSIVRAFRNRFGTAAALPVFLLVWPLTFFDWINPKVPYSLYVKAVKR
jgi:SAM-dependent methyltransferase